VNETFLCPSQGKPVLHVYIAGMELRLDIHPHEQCCEHL